MDFEEFMFIPSILDLILKQEKTRPSRFEENKKPTKNMIQGIQSVKVSL